MLMSNLLKGKPTLGKFEIKKTHMHGLRMVCKGKTNLEEILSNPRNAPVQEESPNLTFEIHSESDYATIFFAQWPMKKLNLFP